MEPLRTEHQKGDAAPGVEDDIAFQPRSRHMPMRKSKPGQLVPYEWRATVNPWTRDDELAKAMILRSAILSCYSHAEQKITDLVMRCSARDEYRELQDKAPFTSGGRFKYLRKVLATDGPLTPFKGVVEGVLARYERGRDFRNLLAHADMEVLQYWGVTFDEIIVEGNEITHRRPRFTFEDLEALAVRASSFSRACQRLHYAGFANTSIHANGDFDRIIALGLSLGREQPLQYVLADPEIFNERDGS